MKFLLIVAALLISVTSLHAQVMTSAEEEPPDAQTVEQSAEATSPWRIFGSLTGGLLPSSISLSGLPGVASCCPEYTDASGWSAGLGFGASYSVSSTVRVEGQLGLGTMQPSTSATEIVPLNDNFETVDGTIQHEIDISILALDIRLGVSAEITSGLEIMAAPSIMIPLSSTFTQTETLTDPQTVEFINGERTWNNADGPLGSAAAVFSLGGGIRYLFDAGGGWKVGPEVWYHYALVDLVEEWRVHRITAGVLIGLP